MALQQLRSHGRGVGGAVPVGGHLPPQVASVHSCVLRVVSVPSLRASVAEQPLSAVSPKAGAGVFPRRKGTRFLPLKCSGSGSSLLFSFTMRSLDLMVTVAFL